MYNNVFGEMQFNSSWETFTHIEFKGKDYRIVVSADAYYENDGITKQQELSYSEFMDNKINIIDEIEKMISDSIFIPVLLIFKRNGDYGLVFDNKNDVEGGIVVTIKPDITIVAIDQYI